MTKRLEPIPFAGMVEIDYEPEVTDRKLFAKTQKEVADELGISRNAVGDVEKKAMKKFKEKFIAKFNKDDYI
jgi:DNA-directed RNA polymerase sigma subunit (sigma70/sigma32)